MARKKEPFYLGGLASCLAACFTHPLELIKVRMMLKTGGKSSIIVVVSTLYKTEGFTGFYSGLSASLLRQITYSTARFGSYEVFARNLHRESGPLPFYKKVICGCMAGAIGGFAGNPADVVNVRMQGDKHSPAESRYNYKHAGDGLIKIARQEGFTSLYRGLAPNLVRAMLMTAGQLATYDQSKEAVIASGLLTDGIPAHFAASLVAGFVATVITSPVDVVKTRIMSAPPYGDNGTLQHHLITFAEDGLRAFMKGFIPAYGRLAPHTTLTFIFLEQLRKHL